MVRCTILKAQGWANTVDDTLKLRADRSHEKIREAASVLLFLGRDYISPVRDLDRHLALAADRLEEVSRLAIVAESQFVDEVGAQILELRSRMKKSGAA